MSMLQKAREFIGFRKQSYQQTFNPENRFNFEVLNDLSRFCRADRTCFHTDPRVHAVLEGRREVWLRIKQHLNLSEDDLVRIYITKDK